MDLVAEMLLAQLQARHTNQLTVTKVCPPLRRRFSAPALIDNQSAAFNADRVINRFWDYPRGIRRLSKEFDLFHIIDHSYSQLVWELPAERTIVTCHDLDTFRCLLEPAQEPRPVWFKAMIRRTLDGFRKAARIICDSPSTYEQVLHYRLVPSERVRMIPLGAHPSCSAEPDAKADAAVTLMLGAKAQSPLLLHVGSTIPRKRIDILLQVLAEIKRAYPTIRLIRVGGPLTVAQTCLAEALKVKDSIITLPFLARDVLAAVYRRATLVLQPSEREGFGLPVAEALACGTPVVASDLAVLREVGGDAAVYCPVGDLATWSSQLEMLLTEREKYPEAWMQRYELALQQAAKFSWVEHTRQVVKIYQELLSQ